mgnify:FL=1
MAVTQGTMNKPFVSAIDFLDQRDIDPNLYDQSRDRDFTDIMRIVNKTKPATMFYYNNFVNNDAYEVGTISAVTSTGLAQIQFTINTATTFPREGDVIMTSNSNNLGTNASSQARVQAVSLGSGTATLTVRSVRGNAYPFYATVGDSVAFSSNAFSEKSSAPANRKYGVTKYYNTIQIFREVDEITDVQKVAKIEVEVNGQYSILPYQIIQKYTKLKGDISVQMLAGEQGGTLFGDATPFLANPSNSASGIQTTGGLDWYCRTYGISDQAAVLGTFGFTELDEIIDNFIANKAPTDFDVFMGSRSYRIISKFLKSLPSASVASVRINFDGKYADFNVEQLKYGGYTFNFIHIPLFDHPQLFSATLRPDVNGSLYFVPKDNVDTVDNGSAPRMQIRYTQKPFSGSAANMSSNGMVTEWRTGALAEIPTSDVMYLQTNWETNQGLECLAVKHFQKYRIV